MTDQSPPTDALSSLSFAEAPANFPGTEQPQERLDEPQKSTFVKFFVGEIGPTSTEDSLRAYFEQFGTVERVIVKHSYHEKQRSFAFVTIDGDAEKVGKLWDAF